MTQKAVLMVFLNLLLWVREPVPLDHFHLLIPCRI